MFQVAAIELETGKIFNDLRNSVQVLNKCLKTNYVDSSFEKVIN